MNGLKDNYIFTLDGAAAARRQRKPHSHRRRQQPVHPTQQLFSINSTRTLWVLSLLLLVTLIVQVLLIAHHEEMIQQLDQFEDEFTDVLSAVNAMANDASNAAYEFRHHFLAMNDEATQLEMIAKYSNYSMDPLDILSRAEVDHSAGYVPSISVREAVATKRKRLRHHPHRKEAELPSVEEIQSLYGNRTHILGLDRCEEYRNSVSPENRLIGPAGLFNSATNLLVSLLRFNCVNVARVNQDFENFTDGILYQAPWGKHNPLSWRLHHETKSTMGRLDQRDFLPIVMVKDPVSWMASMCRHPYEARWPHYTEHCPNLVPNKVDRRHSSRLGSGGTIGLKVKFATRHFGDEPIPDESDKTFIPYKSLVDFWNTWYHEWYDASFPRVMIRFEDLLFHAEETVAQVCTCWGGTMRSEFRYVKNSAKGQKGPHAGSAGFLASLVTYGNSTLRNKGILTDQRDVLYARKNLDEELMTAFGYARI